MATKKAKGFEECMERLETVVQMLENGTEGLDGSLKLYEEGISLIRECTNKLNEAELKVKKLQIQPDGSAVLTDFAGEDAQ